MDSASAAACLAQSSFVNILLIFLLTFVDIGFAHKEDAKLLRNWVYVVVNNHHWKTGSSRTFSKSTISCFKISLFCHTYVTFKCFVSFHQVSYEVILWWQGKCYSNSKHCLFVIFRLNHLCPWIFCDLIWSSSCLTFPQFVFQQIHLLYIIIHPVIIAFPCVERTYKPGWPGTNEVGTVILIFMELKNTDNSLKNISLVRVFITTCFCGFNCVKMIKIKFGWKFCPGFVILLDEYVMN